MLSKRAGEQKFGHSATADRVLFAADASALALTPYGHLIIAIERRKAFFACQRALNASSLAGVARIIARRHFNRILPALRFQLAEAKYRPAISRLAAAAIPN